jgi:alanine racemase
LDYVRAHSNKAVMAVLKAGAYGHGIEQVGLALDTENLGYFGVASVIEARKLQSAGILTPIYTRTHLPGRTRLNHRERLDSQSLIYRGS